MGADTPPPWCPVGLMVLAFVTLGTADVRCVNACVVALGLPLRQGAAMVLCMIGYLLRLDSVSAKIYFQSVYFLHY